MFKKHALTLLLLFLVLAGLNQNALNDIEGLRKNAISFSILGPTPIFGITYERILARKLSLEIGVGLPGAGLGFKF